MDDYGYISADSHLEISCERWNQRVPARYRELAPRMVRSDGEDTFIIAGKPFYGSMNLYAGHTPEEFAPVGVVWEGPGTGGPEQRLAEQDTDGIVAEVLFPGLAGGFTWAAIRDADPDAYRAVVRAYNSYLAEEFCAVAPERLLGLGIIAETGIDDAIAELEYCARAGLPGILLNTFPSGENFPTAADDRFWAAALDLNVPVTIHVQFRLIEKPRGPFFQYPRQIPEHERQPPDFVQRLARYGMRGALNVVQFVMSGVFDRYPRLRVFFAENQIGWVPTFLEQMDRNYPRHRFWAERLLGLPPLQRLPSEYIREHVYWGFFNDRFGVRTREDIGVDRIMWSTDFPHAESHWPESRALADENLAGVPDAERYQLVAGNAIEFFHLRPEAYTRPVAPATTGAAR